MPVGVCETRNLVSMFVGREAPFKPVMCRIQQNKSPGLGCVPLDSVTEMIMLRISVWRHEQLLLSEAIPAPPGLSEHHFCQPKMNFPTWALTKGDALSTPPLPIRELERILSRKQELEPYCT